jgi:hypothetical protein
MDSLNTIIGYFRSLPVLSNDILIEKAYLNILRITRRKESKLTYKIYTLWLQEAFTILIN